MGTKKPVSDARPNRAAQIWVVLLAVLAAATAIFFAYVTVLVALFGGASAFALSIVAWVVLIGTPAALLKRARTRDKGVL